MKKFINDPSNLTKELLEGLALANKDIIDLIDGNLVVNKKLKDADRVTVVTLGGTGHEPALQGFVGEGMADIAVCGDIFAAPGPDSCLEALKMADKGKGVLFVVLNHAGDMLTANLTMKAAKKSRYQCNKKLLLKKILQLLQEMTLITDVVSLGVYQHIKSLAAQLHKENH